MISIVRTPLFSSISSHSFLAIRRKQLVHHVILGRFDHHVIAAVVQFQRAAADFIVGVFA